MTNPFREKIIKIVVNPWFDKIILATIVANSIVLAAEDPAAEKNKLAEILDYIFLTIFSIEMVLKIIAMGFGMRPHSYLRDPWNIVSPHLLYHTIYSSISWSSFLAGLLYLSSEADQMSIQSVLSEF